MAKSKINERCALAIVISLLMAMAMVLMGLTGMTAYAATGEIGFGASNSATVTLTNGGTDTVTIASYIAEGQYMLYFDVTDPIFTGEDEAKYYNIFIDLSWSEGEETYTEYLSYNSELGMYYTILSNIRGGDEITFSAFYDEFTYAGAVTANVYLGGLALGEFNDYDLGNVKLPAEVELRLAAGEHIIAVAPYYYGGEETETFAPTYTVEYDGNTLELTADPDLSYTYIGIINVEGTTTATITGENAGDYLVDIRVYNYKEPETISSTPVTKEMNFNEQYLFSYVADKTGYHKVEATGQVYVTITDDEGNITYQGYRQAIFSLAEKSAPLAVSSTNYPVSDYPLYLTAGETYYFEIAYAEIEGIVIVDPDNPPAGVTFDDVVEATLSVTDWTETTATLDNIAYVPVNVTGDTYRVNFGTFNLDSTYDISLAVFPEEFDFATDSITLHLVKTTGETTYTLDLEGNFSATEISLTDAEYMYVNWSNRGVVGLVVAYTPITANITVDVEQSITLPADRDGRFYIDGLEANKPYQITLSNLTSENVEISGLSGVIVAEGETQGVFIVSEFEASYFFLTITNYNENASASFNILISEVPNVTPLTFNSENEVALAGYETRVYSIDLPVGEYAMRISGNANVRAYTANGTIIDEYNDDQVGRLSVNGTIGTTVTVYIFFANTNSEANNVNVLVTNFGGAIELETEEYITLSATNRNVAYAMNLENGTYRISLGANTIQITIGNTTVIDYGSISGDFTVNIVGAETNEILLFFTYNGSESVTFSVYVEAVTTAE